ncbi:hypothetical protein GCM10010199_71460 [Dactylosporangium roseum]
MATEKVHGAQVVVARDSSGLRDDEPLFGWRLLRGPFERAARGPVVRLYGESRPPGPRRGGPGTPRRRPMNARSKAERTTGRGTDTGKERWPSYRGRADPTDSGQRSCRRAEAGGASADLEVRGQQLDAKPIRATELQDTLIGTCTVVEDWLPLRKPAL